MTNTLPGTGIALDKTPVHFTASGSASAIEGFTFDPSGYEANVASNTSPVDPGRLVFVERSAEAWGMWECHPMGDEMVVILSGVALFIQEIDGAEVRTRVTAGQAVVNPAGTWHTADVEEPFAAMYLTPCPGTHHRPR